MRPSFGAASIRIRRTEYTALGSGPSLCLNTLRSIYHLVLLASPLVALVSCGPSASLMPRPTPRRAEAVLYQWYDDGGPGRVAININLRKQMASYTRGGRDIGWSYVATGKEGYGTRAGRYSITEKIVDKYSNKYGWIEDEFGNVVDDDASPGDSVPAGCHYVAAPMPYWMRLTSYGIGMHAGIIPQPGEPASHGCIRLPKPFAPQLFEVVQVGTPVTITY
jgi:hypothetical protein